MDIFETNEFMCRLDCGAWSRTWMMIYIISNACITWMFVLIGVTFAYLGIKIRKRGLAILVSLDAVERARRVGGVMCAVFMLCAGGHLIENVGAFWWPAYHFFALWHLATLIATAMATIKISKWGIRMLRAERIHKILESHDQPDPPADTRSSP